MKRLTLIRHAKSSHHLPLVQDFHRPLNERGLRDAPLIGKHLKKAHHFAPDCLITSPAGRARTTASLIAGEIDFPAVELQEEPRIYEAPLRDLTAVVRHLPDTIQHAVLVGHNPGLELLANWLCGPQTITGLRTGGVAMMELTIGSWSETDPGCGSLLTYFYPAQIGGGKQAV